MPLITRILLHLIALALLDTLLSTAAWAQHAVSTGAAVFPRIGAEVSVEERQYFGLFPQIDGFRVATIERVDAAHLAFRITAASDTTVVVDTAQFGALASYLERFEQLLHEQLLGKSVSFHEGRRLKGLVKPQPPFFWKSGHVRVGLYGEAEPVIGRLLAANEEAVVVSTGATPMEVVHRPESTTVLLPRNIKYIVAVGSRSRWRGRHLPVGGSQERYRLRVLPHLEDEEIFVDVLPPEVAVRVDAAIAGAGVERWLADEAYIRQVKRRLHVGLSGSAMNSNMKPTFPANGYVDRRDGDVVMGNTGIAMELGYDLTDRVRPLVKLGWLLRPSEAVPVDGERYGGTYLDVGARYMLMRADPFPLSQPVASVGAGVRAIRFDVESQLTSVLLNGLWQESATYSVSTLGAYVSLGLEYYLSSWMSIGGDAGLVAYSETSIPEHRLVHTNGYTVLRRKDRRSVSLHDAELQVGLRLHL